MPSEHCLSPAARHLGTSRFRTACKRTAIEAQPTVYFTVDDKGPGIFGMRGKARAAIDPNRERLRKVIQDQWDRYTGRSDAETSVLMGMVETGDLILAILTPRYLATWGL
jgi:hypothetical protein